MKVKANRLCKITFRIPRVHLGNTTKKLSVLWGGGGGERERVRRERERELHKLIFKTLSQKLRFPNYSTYWYFTYRYMFIAYKGSMYTSCKTTLKLPNPTQQAVNVLDGGAPG